ncbi:MAG: TIGR00725 family protein [Deltaproteobacteria bacterium]|nr:MAG: TIGR00725 family protein [Deltaproteobacteria bacterium]
MFFSSYLRRAPLYKPFHVGVIGAGTCNKAIYDLAREIGYEIGKRGWILVCGGLGGVMEAASKGCTEAGGMTVGLLPGLDIRSANPFIHIAIPTGLGEARNALVVRASHVLVAVSGGYGTLSEIALGLKTGKKVVGLHTWSGIKGIQYAETPTEAIKLVEKELISSR